MGDASARPRAVAAGAVGNVLEWYDFTVYASLATLIGSTFFPNQDRVAALMASFGVFAAGYLVRPLGGACFGYLGDRYGRVLALQASILSMAIPTTLIGCLPTYAEVGLWAPALLVVLRLLQGLSVGGEFTGSACFLVENAPAGRRTFYGSWATVGVAVGVLLGSGMVAVVTGALGPEASRAWGWRLPFLLGGLLGLVGGLLRGRMRSVESAGEKSPLGEFLAHYRADGVRLFLFLWCYSVSFNVVLIFMASYLHTFFDFPLSTAMAVNTALMVVMIVLIPTLGWLGDRFGRKRVLAFGLVGFLLATLPLFLLFRQLTLGAVVAAQLALVGLVAVQQGVVPATAVTVFPRRVRYTSLSISFNFAMALLSGTTPLLCTWLISASGGNTLMPAFYLMASAAVTLALLPSLPQVDDHAEVLRAAPR
jgi:MHS family proline/betaine transporter-like MFS transporter